MNYLYYGIRLSLYAGIITSLLAAVVFKHPPALIGMFGWLMAKYFHDKLCTVFELLEEGVVVIMEAEDDDEG